MKLAVNNAVSEKQICSVTVPDDATVEVLRLAIYNETINQFGGKYTPERQRLLVGKAKNVVALQNGKNLADYAIKTGDTISMKDLGPQAGYQMVFFVEYFGPLLLYPLLFFGMSHKKTYAQQVALVMWTLHYAKRIFETVFVHRFSKPTMPLSNLFKNCGYYWGFTLLVSYFINHEDYTPVATQLQLSVGVTIFVIGEIGNFICHVMLANLRPASDPTARKVPHGFLFELVSCPNYTFEVLAWLGFNIATQTFFGYLFMVAGAAQMFIWAKGKHIAYRKEFPDYPRRKIMFPFLL